MSDPRLQQLAELAGLIRDLRLAALSQQVQACARLRDRLAALDAPMPADTSLPGPTLETVALRHARWAAPRRMLLNEQLAAQTALRLASETQARAAFGRARVLQQWLDKDR